jgi:TRAP-type C4-dicarboxylate transport system permease small subunit
MRAKIDKILEKVLVILMIILVLDVLWQVLSRYVNKFLSSSYDIQISTKFYAFTDELAGFLLVWVALLGAAYATGKKQHLAIELLPSKLNEKNNKILSMIIEVFILMFSVGVLLIGGIWLVYTRFYLGQVSAAMEMPIGLVYLIVPLSGMLISYYASSDFISLFKSLNTK